MLRIDLTTDIDKATRSLLLLTDRQLRFAVATAMNSAVEVTRTELRESMARTSGGPIDRGATRWTLGAVYQRRAREASLQAEAGIRQDTPRAAGRYLIPQIAGTEPRRKAVDLKAAGLAKMPGIVVTPTRNVRLTAQGNVSRATFNRVLSSWGQPGSRYFIAPIRKGSQTRAIFERLGRRNRDILPLFILDQPERRRSTFDLGGQLEGSVRRTFEPALRESIAAELRRAGFR